MRTKEQLFDHFSCDSEKVENNYKNLRELFLVKEFKRCIHVDIRTFINEQQAKSDAARFADNFLLTHKMSHFSKQNLSFSMRNQNTSYDNKPFFGNNRFASKEKYHETNSEKSTKFQPKYRFATSNKI